MASYRTLDDARLDLLRELGNIGSGHAATALSRLLDGRVDIHVPRAVILPLDDVVGVMGGAEVEVVGIMQTLWGDLDGHVYHLYPIVSARMLAERLLRRPATTLGEIETSALCEIANILTGAFLTALGAMTGFRVETAPPADARDMAGALLDGTLAVLAGDDDQILLVETQFVVGGSTLGVHLLFLPTAGGLDRLLGAFGMAP